MLEPLRTSPAFTRLWIGAFVSGLGDGLTWIALQWLMLERSNDSGTAVGLVLLCFGLPAVLTGAPIGRLVDRFGAVPVMVVDNLARAIIIALIPLLDAAGALETWHIFVIAALAGALLPASQIGIRALVPRLVPNPQLEPANAAIALTHQIGAVGPPALAGFLIEHYGTPSAFWVDVLTFVVFVLLLLTVPNHKTAALEPNTQQRNAWTILRQYPTFLSLVLLTVAFYAAYGPLEAALPVLAKSDLLAGAQAYGLMWTAGGFGTILGNILFSPSLLRWKAGLVLPAITLGWGIMQVLLAFLPDITAVTVWMFISGLIWGPYMGLEATTLQRLIPQAQHGEVFGARQAFVGPAAPLGMALGGLMLIALSPRWVLGLSALACVLAGVTALASKRIRKLEGGFVTHSESAMHTSTERQTHL